MSTAAALRVCIARQPGGEGLPLPTQATPGSAGFDLAAAVETECVLQPGERILVPTGFAIAVPRGYEAQIRPRSGLALRHGIVLPNAPGTIDSDYRGEVMVLLINLGHETFVIRHGERVAQMVIAPVVQVSVVKVDALPVSGRGAGGFGSTGVS